MVFFILGRNTELSKAEILNEFKKTPIAAQSADFLILDLELAEEQINALQKKLGGTIKIGEIEMEAMDKKISEEELFNLVESIAHTNGWEKIFFGFSFYGDFLPSDGKNYQRIGLNIKSQLKDSSIAARFVVSQEKNLSSVIVQKEHLITRGVELCFLKDGANVYLGRTLAVQDFKSFGIRDYGRENIDTRSGMLPPKVARMMINLSSSEPESIILDPFCGSGTVLAEALDLGYKNVIGGDKSPKAIADTEKNIDWLIADYFKKDKSEYSIQLFNLDARQLSTKIAKESIDAIVTEPYLGPPQGSNPDTGRNEYKKEMANLLGELKNLYLQSFQEFHKVLKPHAKAIVIFPEFQFGKIGFTPPGFKLLAEYPYFRPEQRVRRNVMVFEKI